MLWGLGFTHRPLSSSFLGLPYRILNMNHKKELLRGLWVGFARLKQHACQGGDSVGSDTRPIKSCDGETTSHPVTTGGGLALPHPPGRCML